MAMQLTLQPRLQAIAGLVPQGVRLADVGTDHGYLPIYLLQHHRISSAIATDLHPGPLDRGRQTAQTYGMEKRIIFCLCDGLQAVDPQTVDTVVIAGMGGETIAAILDAVPWSREKLLLLQPMSRAEFLRPWLMDHGYAIGKEELVLDKGHIYPILQVTGGTMAALSVGEIYYGLSRPDGPLFAAYLQNWKSRLEKAAAGLRQSKLPGDRLTELEAALAALREREEFLCQP